MKNIFPSDKILIGKSSIGGDAGRGVFAKVNIKQDEIIESCPIIELSKFDMANLNESLLTTYFFFFGEDNDHLAVALGFGSIYNHAYNPNAKYEIFPEQGIINFIAVKDIKRDEEITFNYNNGNPKDKIPLWVEKAG